MSLLHSSHRPRALTDRDYDHEIRLLDRTRSPTPHRSRSASARPTSLPPVSTSPDRESQFSRRRHSEGDEARLPNRISLRLKLNARKYSRFQDRREGDGGELEDGHVDDSERNGEAPGREERGRTMGVGKARPRKEPESAIDILYENQRGGFLCGIPLFSAQALGGLDPGPWTNSAQKPSATDITNAQVPDPTWQWAWKEWVVHHQEGLDEDGWEYSFAFAKPFSWHGPHYWNSFVRRRAWIRKRMKKPIRDPEDEEGTNGGYFTIRSPSRSKSRASSWDGNRRNRNSMQSSRRGGDDEVIVGDIEDIDSLMRILRCCRIDREKMEAVENFIEHGKDELYHLRERMHDIMKMFIFQASRQLLLTHLLKIFNECNEELQQDLVEKKSDHRRLARLNHLHEAVKHAAEEVQKLEFWSDVKVMTESSGTNGVKGTGIGRSGPKVVPSNGIPSWWESENYGVHDPEDNRENGLEGFSASTEGQRKGKGIA
jgi:hypothetical protein